MREKMKEKWKDKDVNLNEDKKEKIERKKKKEIDAGEKYKHSINWMRRKSRRRNDKKIAK